MTHHALSRECKRTRKVGKTRTRRADCRGRGAMRGAGGARARARERPFFFGETIFLPSPTRPNYFRTQIITQVPLDTLVVSLVASIPLRHDGSYGSGLRGK